MITPGADRLPPEDLDPGTLRRLANELDDDADRWAQHCPCAVHQVVVTRLRHLATDYRTRAIRIDQAAASRAKGEPA